MVQPSESLVDIYGRLLPRWTEKELANYRYVRKMCTPGIPLTHDLSIPHELEFVISQHGGREFMAKYYPATLHLLLRGAEAAQAMKAKGKDPRKLRQTLFQMDSPPVNQWASATAITSAAFNSPGSTSCQAVGIATALDGAIVTQVTMTLLDMGAGGQQFAQETIPDVYDQFGATIYAQGTATTTDVEAVLTATVIPQGSSGANPDAAPASTQITALPATCPTSPPTITAPVHTKTAPGNPMKVALNRTAQQQPDCDYYYTTGMNGRVPNVAVQISGSAPYSQNVCTPFNFGGNLSGSVVLQRRTDPGGAALALTNTQFASGISASPANTLVWNWGSNNLFGGAPWDQGQIVDLIVNIGVVVGPSSACSQTATPNANITVSSVPGNTGSNCVAVIDPLEFFWGCMAAETRVLMADGSMKPVALVETGDVVICGREGYTARVKGKTIGFEDREPCLRISAGDRQIIVSQDHAMMAQRGPIRAAELLIGQQLRTLEGLVRIRDIERVRYRNQVYGIHLQPLDAPPCAAAPGVEGTTHIADGFLVGDSVMQRSLMERRRQRSVDHAAVMRDMPREFHLDYENIQRARLGEPLIASRK